MDYLRNHCWCSDSNWGGNYDCQIIVSLSSYKEGYKQDWDNLIETKDYLDEELYEINKKLIPEATDQIIIKCSTRKINTLKPKVLKWLEDNVQDFEEDKGWCVGSDEYVATDSCSSYSVFFQRRKDAMKFIKTFSVWEKPIHYCQYFTDVRKTLNLLTLKY